ncbi:TetR/AcrR family transcriptional regulator [Microbacterium sp. NPDC077663]|uniref:TetR/AcrR family transcriptional regulator n=1 Tax=Microbacterium sp. NPDC077663 TaxID=3364189 RepID=UPI0037C591FA
MTTEQVTPRVRILSVAKDVFAEGGYRGGSLNEIAKRAGYTRAGVLHYFPSKNAILLELLKSRDERLSTFDDANSELNILETLEDLPNLVGRVIEDRPLVQLAHALTAEASDPAHPAREWAAARHRALRELTAQEIRTSIAEADLDPDTDVEALAAVLLGAVEGVEAQWLIDDSIDPVRCASILRDMLRALSKRDSR